MVFRDVAGNAERGGGFRTPAALLERKPLVRWLLAGCASALLGGLLTWGTLVDGGIVLLFELTSGAIGLLAFLLPNDRSHSVFVMVMVVVTAVTYGIIGALVTAARDHRPAFASALLAVGLFAVGVMVEFAVREFTIRAV